MKQLSLISYLKQLSFVITLSGAVCSSALAQNSNPKGLYELSEIVHQDGKHMELNYSQYKYCMDQYTLMLTHGLTYFKTQPLSFTISNPDGKPLKLTGELSKTENRGIQVIGTSDSTFTLRWFNDQGAFNEQLFPYQTNIDELYVQVKDTTDNIQQALNLLQMKVGAKRHRLQGVWKLRGKQHTNTATSQYWIEQSEQETYQIFGDGKALIVYANADFPQGNMGCLFSPCTYLADNAYDCDGHITILNWFDRNTVSQTTISEEGQPFVTVWDRCGLPQNIQDVFGTNVPQMKKDISRFTINGFERQYGSKPDSIRLAFETFDYCVNINEQNNAIVPILMRAGFETEYKTLKESLLSRLMQGEITADEAVGSYVYWFYKYFDRHTHCSSNYFYQHQPEGFVNYTKVIPQYAPEPVGCKVDKETYLLRLPSCTGDVPSWDWLKKKEAEFKQSGCKYLILDLRGNYGGADKYSLLFTEFMYDCNAMNDMQFLFLNGTENVRDLKQYAADEMSEVIAEAENAEEGTLVNWSIIKKGTGEYTPLVRKGGIIIDNFCASAGESPVRWVRNNSKNHAIVFGRERTMGCELSGNCHTVRLPHSNISLTYPTCVDAAFEQACKDKQPGHKPDVIIPLPYPKQLTDNIDPWVLWVAKQLKKK